MLFLNGPEFEGDERQLAVTGPNSDVVLAGQLVDMSGGTGLLFNADGSGAVGVAG